MSRKDETGQRPMQTRRSQPHPVLETGGKTEQYKNLELTSSHRHTQIITHSWVTADEKTGSSQKQTFCSHCHDTCPSLIPAAAPSAARMNAGTEICCSPLVLRVFPHPACSGRPLHCPGPWELLLAIQTSVSMLPFRKPSLAAPGRTSHVLPKVASMLCMSLSC